MKKIQVAPEIVLKTKRIGQSLGKSTILQCSIHASPSLSSEWQRDGLKITSGS